LNPGRNSPIPYISDIGSANLGLFIPFCSLTAFFYFCSHLVFVGVTGKFGDGIESPYYFSALALALAAATCLVIMACFSSVDLTVAHFVMACCFVFLASCAACVNFAGNRMYCSGRPDGDPCVLSRKAKVATFVFAVVAAGLTLGFGIACWESPVFGDQPCYALNTAAVVFEWTLVCEIRAPTTYMTWHCTCVVCRWSRH
jgi:hypothetical protein